jgi:uncharacterized protein YndB with AHSA1/START domain
MRLDVAIEELLPVPVERAWHALTDRKMLGRWLMNSDDFEATVGTRFTLRDEPRADCRAQVECEVLEITPPKRMVWSWRGAEDPATTRLVIELDSHESGTLLTLRHTGEADERTVRGTTAGWTQKLRQLAAMLSETSIQATDKGDDHE